MEANSLLRALRSKVVSFPRLLQRVRAMSSTAVAEQFYSSDEDSLFESPVYRHSQKIQAPSTIRINSELRRRKDLWNSASFIGTVDKPILRVNSPTAIGAYTTLNVKSSRSSKPDFRILLKMWDQMAEISIKHLRPNDFIYVSGWMSSFGVGKTVYQLNVKEINYVLQRGQTWSKDEKYRPKEESDAEKQYECDAEKQYDHLRLWQSLFTYPNDWWDNRKDKWNPNGADFKHKTTGQVLKISSEDPLWVKRQLELHDSRPIWKDREESPMMFNDFGRG